MSVDEWESMCTPMHEILASEPLPGSEACKRSGALFLGSWVASVDTELLKCNSIQAIVEVHDSPWGVSPLPTPGMSQPPEDCYNGEEYESRDCQPTRYKVAITDCTEKDVIKPHLQGVVRHIHECLSNGENVLVHCQQVCLIFESQARACGIGVRTLANHSFPLL